MIQSLLERLGLLFDNLAIPGDVVEVFRGMADLWETLPLAFRVVFIGCFSVVCLFAIIKMLF